MQEEEAGKGPFDFPGEKKRKIEPHVLLLEQDSSTGGSKGGLTTDSFGCVSKLSVMTLSLHLG